ncbi:F-box protein, partial [Corchorus olitorius]
MMRLATFCNITLPCPVQTIPNLEKKGVWHCNFGWILVSQAKEKGNQYHHDQFSTWKPQSSMVDLPPLSLQQDEKIGFAKIVSPPESDDDKPAGCMVLLFESVCRNFIFCSAGDKQWNRICIGEEIDGNYVAHSGGNLYAATSGGMLMVMGQNMPESDHKFKFTSLNCGRPYTAITIATVFN